jgi:hypothetical protein
MFNIAQFGNCFINVFALGVSMHPYEEKIVVHMQDRNGNTTIVKCNCIDQMIKGSVSFDKSFKVITEIELEPVRVCNMI